MELLANIIGMLGTACVVGVYVLQQMDKLDAKDFAYNFYNLLGAILLLISLLVHFNLASFIIELFWIAASVLGLIKYFQRRRQ